MKKYLEYKDEKSHKFWQIEVKKNSFTVSYGKIGAKGEVRVVDFLDDTKTLLQAEKLIKQKLKKGYQEVAIPKEKPKTDKPTTKKTKKSKNNEIDYYEALKKFDDEYGSETYAESFYIIEDEDDFFENWLDIDKEQIKEYSKGVQVFASADGTGARYAFWFTDGNTDKNKAPIIYYGSEGAIIVIAENIKDLIKMLSFGAECMNGSFYHSIYDDEDFYEDFIQYTSNFLAFREWMKDTLNIEPVSLDGLINNDEGYSEEVDKLQEKAEKNIKKAFDKWQYQFYKNWEAEEEKERVELYKKYEENKKKLLVQVAENPSVELYLKLAENQFSLDNEDIDEKIQDQRDAFLEQALALDKNNIECLKELASSYQYANPQKAIELYNRLIPMVDNPEEYYADIAGSYQENEDYEQALAYYTKAILAGESGWDGAYQRYIIDICDEINGKDGLDVLEEIAKQKPAEDTYKVLYIQYFKEKQYEKSLEFALKYIDISDKQNFVTVGEKFFKKELYQEALTIFEKVLSEKKDSWSIKVVNYIGLCYLRIKPINVDKALDAFKKAYQINNNENAIHQNINLCGSKYLDEKAYEKAISTFQFCIDNNFVQDMAVFNIGASYVLQQEYQKALPYYEEALKLKPDNEKYQKAVNYVKTKINNNKGLFGKLFGKK